MLICLLIAPLCNKTAPFVKNSAILYGLRLLLSSFWYMKVFTHKIDRLYISHILIIYQSSIIINVNLLMFLSSYNTPINNLR